MTLRGLRLVVAWVVVSSYAALAYGQGGATSSISGTVVDANGGVIPGATVEVKEIATGSTFPVVTNETGSFTVPSLPAGVYSVTVTLQGFKTAVINDVRVVPGTPASVKAVLEVGQLEETITVQSSSELINTQTATIASTLNVDQINQMPMPSRNALNAVTFLPGVNTNGINRNTTVNGLPESFLNITLDGISNNDNFNKTTDGFFASVTPRQDAVEAVTVTSAVQGAETGGHGAVGINFVTRSGTNRFTGSGYEYFRHPSLNSNTWFNERDGLPKNDIKLNQYGIRQGGPVVIPGLFDGRNKAFFFVNYEQLRFPNAASRTRTTLHPRAQQGIFRYDVAGQLREVNVLELAARNGQISATDPTIMRLFGLIESSMQTTGTISPQTDPLLMRYAWQSPGEQFEHQPVVRVDYNLTNSHRLTGTFSRVMVTRDPDQLNSNDVRFPGAPNYGKFVSSRPLGSLALRSTLSSNLVNEFRFGTTRGGGSFFGQESSNSPETFADQGGYAIDFDTDLTLTNWWIENGPTWRSAYNYSFDETLSWQRGTHSFNMGGGVYLQRAWENGQQMVPGINIRFDTANDPAAGLFTPANFPDASNAHLADARALYALLTGRVGAVTGQAALDENTGQYVAFGPRRRAGQMNDYSLFIQDSWRMTPALTINAGLRWDVQTPFAPVNDIMSQALLADVCGISGLGSGSRYDKCNFYDPNASGGKIPEFSQFTADTNGYKTDWNNIAPNVGVAWRPNVQDGWLRTVLGDPEQATLRGGYSVAYERQGMGVFTGQFGANPGSTLSLTRDANTGLVNPGETWPVLLSQPERLYNATFAQTPSFPIALRANRADSIEAFAPDIVVASARTWTVSFQRSITKDMAVDVRYVGTRGVNQWSELNYNERNIIENGFVDEFQLAMNNLRANNASGISGRAGSFAYFGSGSGTNPLPIYLAYLTGSRDATNPAAYTGGTQTWTNTTLAGRLVAPNPQPQTAANDLDGDLTRRQAAARAGLPANFFVVNPDLNQVNVQDSGAFSDYHALQVELRRRLSKGLQINGSYQYAIEGTSAFQGFRYGRVMNDQPNVRHAVKTQWDWTVPVGRGQKFGGNMNAVLDSFLGGWTFNGVGRVQAASINIVGPSNVRLVGMGVEELTEAFKFDVRVDPATGIRTVYTLPDDIILNTRRAFSTSTTSATGYSALGVPEGRYLAPDNSVDCIELQNGDCAPRTLLIRAPIFTRFDIGIAKRFELPGSMNFEFKVDVLNVFDNINFTITDNSRTAGAGAGIFQTNAAYSDVNNTFDPGGRVGQLMFRLNW